MTRTELKTLIKECLLEIITEGTPKNVTENVKERNVRQTSARPALDLIRHGELKQSTRQLLPQQNTVSRPKQNPAVFKDLVGGNDVMASIFADTASSGLVERLGSTDNQNHQSANPVIDTGVDPTLFEGSTNWATMAFSEKKSARG